MHYHVFYKDPSEKNAHILLERLTTILEKEPDFAPGLAALANLYTNVYLNQLDQNSLNQALSLGKKAVELQANNQVCQMYYAYALLVDNQLEEAGKRFDKALSLNPNAPIYSGTIGFCLCLMTDSERGFKLVRRSMELDFQYPEWLHVGTFLYYLEKKDYDNLFIEAHKMVKPVLYWTSLAKLVACQKLNQHEEASKHLNELKEIKPDFFDRPNEYITCLVKSEALSKEILDAFNVVLNATDKAFSK
jgi:tetratricopeptide (TPR) repeat protein